MVKGSCLCRGVQYELRGPVDWMMSCHCSMCRKAHGAAFVTFAAGKAEDFHVVAGEDLIARYESSPGSHRPFCRVCGSNLPGVATNLGLVFLPAGGLNDDPVVRPSGHIFVGSKAPWFEITDDLPRHEEFPAAAGS